MVAFIIIDLEVVYVSSFLEMTKNPHLLLKMCHICQLEKRKRSLDTWEVAAQMLCRNYDSFGSRRVPPKSLKIHICYPKMVIFVNLREVYRVNGGEYAGTKTFIFVTSA